MLKQTFIDHLLGVMLGAGVGEETLLRYRATVKGQAGPGLAGQETGNKRCHLVCVFSLLPWVLEREGALKTADVLWLLSRA